MKQALKQYLPSPVIGLIRSVKRQFTVPEHRVAEERARTVRAAFAERIKGVGDGPKVIYALTPTADWPNIGDHAQIFAIRAWIEKHFPALEVIEVSKDEAICCTDLLGAVATKRDLVLLHSGGNLGDRGLWSETARRSIIRSFPHNTIVSLPQTISFSNTPVGQQQKRETSRIYSRHKHLTIIGRDQISAALAAEMFPANTTMAMPDFVLSLDPTALGVDIAAPTNGKILACIRNDDESDISAADRARLIESLGRDVTVFDTHLDGRLEAEDRSRVIIDTIKMFATYDAVVTDRFHGTIFSVLCRKPTVVLPSVDHKLVSGVTWFKDISNVTLCDTLDDVPVRLRQMMAVRNVTYPDFNALYFDRLPALIGAGQFSRIGA